MTPATLRALCLAALASTPPLPGCLLTENPAYEASEGSTAAPIDSTGIDTDPTAPVYPCPDDQPFTLWYPDADADTYGDRKAPPIEACVPPPGHVEDARDCNDHVPEIHPGVAEQCNSIDDNCNALVDESSIECDVCVLELSDAFAYWVCPQKQGITWAEADQRCRARISKSSAVRLASVHDPAEHTRLAALVSKHIPPVAGQQRAWLGLFRREAPDPSCDPPDPTLDWQWKDGTPFDLDPPWNYGQPDNTPDDCTCDPTTGCVERCAGITVIAAHNYTGWSDLRCDAPVAAGYICKARRDPVLFP